MSYLADIQAYLIAQAPATFTSTNTFINFMPASPAAAVCLYPYSGQGKLYNTDGDGVGRPGLQVRVRHQTPETAWTWLSLIESTLKGVQNTALSGTAYLCIRPANTPSQVGWNNNSLTLMQNFEVLRSE